MKYIWETRDIKAGVTVKLQNNNHYLTIIEGQGTITKGNWDKYYLLNTKNWLIWYSNMTDDDVVKYLNEREAIQIYVKEGI